jgi:hypothetical protein
MLAAIKGFFVISKDIRKVSTVPIILHVIAFNADLDLLTFMMAIPFYHLP